MTHLLVSSACLFAIHLQLALHHQHFQNYHPWLILKMKSELAWIVAMCNFFYSPSCGTYKNIYPIPQRGLTSCKNIYLVMPIVQMMISKIFLSSLQANTIGIIWNVRGMLLCMQSLPPSICMKTIRIIRNIQDVLTVQQENANFKKSGGHGPHISLKAR